MAASSTSHQDTTNEDHIDKERVINVEQVMSQNELIIYGLIHIKVTRLQVSDWYNNIQEYELDQDELIRIFLLLIGSSVKSIIFHIQLERMEDLVSELQHSGIVVGMGVTSLPDKLMNLDFIEMTNLGIKKISIPESLSITAVQLNCPTPYQKVNPLKEMERYCSAIQKLKNLELVIINFRSGYTPPPNWGEIVKSCLHQFKDLEVAINIPIDDTHCKDTFEIPDGTGVRRIILNQKEIYRQSVSSLSKMISQKVSDTSSLGSVIDQQVKLTKFHQYLIGKKDQDHGYRI